VTITTTSFTPETPLYEILRDPRGKSVIERYLPGLVSSSVLHTLHGFPVGLIVDTEAALDAGAGGMLLDELRAIDLTAPVPPRSRESWVEPSADYEPDDVAPASAQASASETVARWDRFELALDGPSHGNPFVDVAVTRARHRTRGLGHGAGVLRR
jgi:hypothetical protein